MGIIHTSISNKVLTLLPTQLATGNRMNRRANCRQAHISLVEAKADFFNTTRKQQSLSSRTDTGV